MSFSRYNTDDQVVSSETVVRGLWGGDNNQLSSFYTSSTYTEYYLDVYDTTATSSYYGMMFPDLNIIILNATSGSSTSLLPYLTSSVNVSQITASAANNGLVLYKSIVSGSLFKLQSEETVSSTYFFTRVKNSEYNYTTNPSIIDDNGNLLYTTLINNPQTYVTSVGMYNDNNELLAVAKLSRPLTKDFTKEALIRIKLDY